VCPIRKFNCHESCFIKRFVPLLTCAVIVVTCKSPVRVDKTNSWMEDMTISDLQQGYKEAKYTIKEVTTAYLDRISAIDKNGPDPR
jgi:hypothetical protein